MSILMYKQRHAPPNQKKTAKGNYAHVGYIATRPGASKNEGMRHGLFGKMNPGELQEFDTWQEVAREVKRLSEQKVTMYRGIISFTETTAKELNLLDHKAWENYVSKQVYILAKENGISLKNLGWCAANHNEKGHPHAHIMFWDKAQEVPIMFVHPKIPNKIRVELIKNTFDDKIEAYLKKKDMLKVDIRNIHEDLLKEFEEAMKTASKKQLDKMKSGEYKSTPLDGLLTEVEINRFADKLFTLRNLMPKSGRITYQLLPEGVKSEVDRVVEELIIDNQVLAKLLAEFVQTNVDLKMLYETNPDNLQKHREKIEAQAKKMIANQILGGIRSIIKKEVELKGEEFQKRQKIFIVEQLIYGLLQFMEQKITDISDQYEDMKFVSHDLSKQAKKDLYLKLKDKGIEP